MRISGVELSNFRSIGPEAIHLSPLNKVNIIIGQNNSGKSNVIEGIRHLTDAVTHRNLRLSEVDSHNRSGNEMHFRLHFSSEQSDDDNAFRFNGQPDPLWFDFSLGQSGAANYVDNSYLHVNDFGIANELLSKINQETWHSRVSEEEIKRKFKGLDKKIFERNLKKLIPKFEKIPEFRKIEEGGGDYQFAGNSLITLLSSYQHPPIGNDTDKEKFLKIQSFVRGLLHLPDATLEVPEAKDTIIISNQGLRLPIESFGTGVHELVIMVTAVLSIDNSICAIEEPEIHLHPRLQREFVKFLIEDTTNIYLLSTHSPSIINLRAFVDKTISEQIQVFHLQLQEGATKGGPIIEESQILNVIDDIGAKPSDLLQANCILWVEGPSDRVYIKHWLSLLEPELLEGFHFSIMFYGGKLLSQLTLTRDDIFDDLTNLLKINQRSIVVIDSDKSQADDVINQTKIRIKEECEESGGYCWVTEGKEIENYIPPEVINTTIKSYKGLDIKIKFDIFDKLEVKLTESVEQTGQKLMPYNRAKVLYSKLIVDQMDVKQIQPELAEHLKSIIDKIKEWNN